MDLARFVLAFLLRPQQAVVAVQSAGSADYHLEQIVARILELGLGGEEWAVGVEGVDWREGRRPLVVAQALLWLPHLALGPTFGVFYRPRKRTLSRMMHRSPLSGTVALVPSLLDI